jgi:hypothetical protein
MPRFIAELKSREVITTEAHPGDEWKLSADGLTLLLHDGHVFFVPFHNLHKFIVEP